MTGSRQMKAVVFHGAGDIRLEKVSDPKIKEPTDASARLTATAICGTDLHMIRGTLPGMKPGTILGYEGVGVVEEIGITKDAKDDDVKTFATKTLPVIEEHLKMAKDINNKLGG